ncbi:hypothetical protein D3C75_872000 [compost metagenome]
MCSVPPMLWYVSSFISVAVLSLMSKNEYLGGFTQSGTCYTPLALAKDTYFAQTFGLLNSNAFPGQIVFQTSLCFFSANVLE